MSTTSESKIAANQLNAQSSTGPRTPEGKARSARNATKLGLFSANVLVRPEQEADFQRLSASLWKSLGPEDALQESLAIEIVRAAWRLERCAEVEAGLFDSMLETGLDPMQNEANCRVQAAVDRARAQAHTILRRATADLRRLQTDRQIARETLPGKNIDSLGVVSMKEVWNSLNKKIKTFQLNAKFNDEKAQRALALEDAIAADEVRRASAKLFPNQFAKQTQPVAA